MNLKQELEALRHSQHAIEDDYRLCSDGSVRASTITRSGDIGWKIIAKPIPGASPRIATHFPDGYLSIDDIRRALDVRDLILTEVVEAATVRSMENVVRKRVKADEAKAKAKPKRPKTTRVAPPHQL